MKQQDPTGLQLRPGLWQCPTRKLHLLRIWNPLGTPKIVGVYGCSSPQKNMERKKWDEEKTYGKK